MFWLEFNFGHVGRHHWSLIVICYPGDVVNINGEFFSHVLFKYFLLNIFILRSLFQTKSRKSHLGYHVYCIWILSRDIIMVWKTLCKGISEWHFHALNFLLFFNLSAFILSTIMTVICLKNGKRWRMIHMEKTSHQDSWICIFSPLRYVLLTF